MPLVAKGITLLTVAYAVSPIDLIPDGIPILGYMDEFLILPLGIALVTHLTPRHIYLRHLNASSEWEVDPRIKNFGIVITITVWVIIAFIILYRINSK